MNVITIYTFLNIKYAFIYVFVRKLSDIYFFACKAICRKWYDKQSFNTFMRREPQCLFEQLGPLTPPKRRFRLLSYPFAMFLDALMECHPISFTLTLF